MRLLVLFLLVACGKNQFPALLDLADSDGDGIPNYQESGIERYLADETPVPILGRLVLTGKNKGQVTDIVVSNEAASEFILGQIHRPRVLFLDALAEGRLLLPKTRKSLNLDEGQYSVEFDLGGSRRSSLSIILSDGSKRILDLRYQGTALKKELILDILSGAAIIEVSAEKQPEPKKTFNVFLQTQTETKILRVSKELPRSELLAHLGATAIENGVNDALSAHSDMSERVWVSRPLGDHLFLGHLSREQIRSTYLGSMSSESTRLIRRDGLVQAPIRVRKKLGEKIFLRLRPTLQHRIFRESERIETHYNRKLEAFLCPTRFREEIGTATDVPGISEFFSWIEVLKFYDLKTLQSKGLARDLRIRNDSRGNFYELILDVPLEEVQINLRSLPPENTVTVGRYYRLYPFPNLPLSTHTVSREKSLEVELEVFVEKLE